MSFFVQHNIKLKDKVCLLRVALIHNTKETKREHDFCIISSRTKVPHSSETDQIPGKFLHDFLQHRNNKTCK